MSLIFPSNGLHSKYQNSFFEVSLSFVVQSPDVSSLLSDSYLASMFGLDLEEEKRNKLRKEQY